MSDEQLNDLYVPITFEKEDDEDLTMSIEEILFYTTIPKVNKVFIEGEGKLMRKDLYLCNILKIEILYNNHVRYWIQTDQI